MIDVFKTIIHGFLTSIYIYTNYYIIYNYEFKKLFNEQEWLSLCPSSIFAEIAQKDKKIYKLILSKQKRNLFNAQLDPKCNITHETINNYLEKIKEIEIYYKIFNAFIYSNILVFDNNERLDIIHNEEKEFEKENKMFISCNYVL